MILLEKKQKVCVCVCGDFQDIGHKAVYGSVFGF